MPTTPLTLSRNRPDSGIATECDVPFSAPTANRRRRSGSSRADMRPSKKVSSQKSKPMLRQPVSSDLLLPDGRAHGDDDGKAASYERERHGRRRGSKADR